jgi:hypothetical protein
MIYEGCLDLLENHRSFDTGFCYLLSTVVQNLSQEGKINSSNTNGSFLYAARALTEKNFPELFHYKPFWVKANNGNFHNFLITGYLNRYWWKPENIKKRIEILKKILAIMKKQC